MSVGWSVGCSVGDSVGNAFVRWSTRRTLLAYLALFCVEIIVIFSNNHRSTLIFHTDSKAKYRFVPSFFIFKTFIKHQHYLLLKLGYQKLRLFNSSKLAFVIVFLFKIIGFWNVTVIKTPCSVSSSSSLGSSLLLCKTLPFSSFKTVFCYFVWERTRWSS